LPTSGGPPQTETAAIRQAEQEEADAMLRGDTAALDKIWMDDMLAYSTSNLYASKSVLLDLIKGGAFRLRSHKRITMHVVVDGDRALAVGNENSQFDDPRGGSIMLNSYLNVWVRQPDRWKLFGRHVGLMMRMRADSISG
jgi:ketosteroid isomerase-like protein